MTHFNFIVLLLLSSSVSSIFANDHLDFEKLIDLASRYDCPQPSETDKLVVGWEGSWRQIGNSNSKLAGIYRPAFIKRKISNTATQVLMGFATVTCESRKTIPSTREFTLTSPKEERDGFSISHNHISSFESCIQLARRGERDLANKLWIKFQNRITSMVSTPKKECIRYAPGQC